MSGEELDASNTNRYSQIPLQQNNNDCTGDLDVIPVVGIEIAHGYSYLNMFTYFYASLINVAALVFINGALPYLLLNVLDIPESQQGGRVGDMGLCNEISIIATVTLWGSLSDKVGRKWIYVVGFLIMALSVFLHPTTTSFEILIVCRVIFAIGAAASVTMLTSILGDYPTEISRGRTGGVIGVTSGLGALLGLFVFLQIPKWAHLPSTVANGQVMYWCFGGWLLISAVVLAVGLSGHKNDKNRHESYRTILIEGFLAAKDPKIALSYFASFAARGDSVVITSLLSLWITQYEMTHGSSSEEATSQAGVISGVCQTVALVSAPFFGFLADKIDKTICQTIAAAIATIGYFLLFFVEEPRGAPIYIAVCIVGIGEIGMIVSSQILIASASPPDTRGAVSGFFSLAGSLSVLISTKLGGHLFDVWKVTGPFFLVGLYNAVVMIFGIILFVVFRNAKHNNNANNI